MPSIAGASVIPLTRNQAGFPDGVTGKDLIGRMRQQAELYGTVLQTGRVTAIARSDEGFVINASGTIAASLVLVATGVTNWMAGNGSSRWRN